MRVGSGALTTSRKMRRASGCWFLSGWNSRASRRYALRICAGEAPERRPSVSYLEAGEGQG